MEKIAIKISDLRYSSDPTKLIADTLMANGCPIYWKGGSAPKLKPAEECDLELPVAIYSETSPCGTAQLFWWK